jgi:hypothetical protein
VIDSDLPETPDEISSAQEIARRAVALFTVVAIALGTPRSELITWLEAEDLWSELSPIEMQFVLSDSPTEKQIIDASWRSEALVVLLWSLGLVEKLPTATELVEPASFQTSLPPFSTTSAKAFVESSHRRSDHELLEMGEELLNLHWEARDAAINSRASPTVNIEIIQERHHAINWVLGYDGASWDEVPTDT